jgi:xanthine dehydrogenase small subunit
MALTGLVEKKLCYLIPELYQINKKGSKLEVGARVTLSEVRDAVKASVPEFARFLDLFASPQIKNVATLVGNLANASPIADTPPFLLVSNNSVVGPRGKRKIRWRSVFWATGVSLSSPAS